MKKEFFKVFAVVLMLITVMGAFNVFGADDTISASIGVNNVAPSVASVAIISDDNPNNYTTGNITGSYTYTDNNNDGDYSIFEWYNQTGLIGKQEDYNLKFFLDFIDDSTTNFLMYLHGFEWSSDGTKLYGVYSGTSGDRRCQMNCSQSWNVSSCSVSYTSGTVDSSISSYAFSPDGTKLIATDSFAYFHRLNCSVAWNLQTCSFDASYGGTSLEASGIYVLNDTHFYYSGSDGEQNITMAVCDYVWNFTNCNYDVNSKFFSTSPSDVLVSDDGAFLYISYNSVLGNISQYVCSNNFNLSSCSLDFTYSTYPVQPSDLLFGGDNNEYFYFSDERNAYVKVRQYMSNGLFLDSMFTSKGDTVWLNVTPNDGVQNGTEVKSNVITILNTAPTTPSLGAISPSPAYTTSVLSVSCSGSSDADGDAITYNYRWNNGTTNISEGIGNSSISCTGGCHVGVTMTVYCKAVTSDANSSETSTNRVISSTAPTFDESVSAQSVHHHENLFVKVNVSDVDVTEGYESLVFGVNNSMTIVQSHTLYFNITDNPSQGDAGVYNLTYSASDGTTNTTNSFIYTVINDAPTIPSTLSVSPDPVNKSVTTLTVSCSGSSDTESDSITYTWRIKDTDNATELLGWSAVATTYDCNGDASCTRGDVLNVECRASDGALYSSYKLIQKTVSDSPPTVPVINAITPGTAYKNDSLSSSASSNCTDVDSDVITREWVWFDTDNATVLLNSSATSFNCTSEASCTKSDTINLRLICNANGLQSVDWSNTVQRSISNSVPLITNNPNPPAITPVSNTSAVVVINFTSFDYDGASDLNTSSASIELNKTGESNITYSACSVSDSGYSRVFLCNVSIPYYSTSGLWSIRHHVLDIDDADPIRNNGTVTINSLDSVGLNDSVINWAGLSPGSTYNEGDSLKVWNFGNTIYSVVNVTGSDAVSGVNTIFAQNFSVDVSSGQVSGTDFLANTTSIVLSGGALSKGSGANEIIFNYLNLALNMPSGTYASTNDFGIGLY